MSFGKLVAILSYMVFCRSSVCSHLRLTRSCLYLFDYYHFQLKYNLTCLRRVQQLLRLAYAHVQMTLYRPFLHYVSQKTCSGKTMDERSYACAAACISVSRNIVHITTEMKRRGLLIGTYWFTVYTTFFAILALVFFVLENPDKPGSQEILADAIDGNDALQGLAKTSQAADRCSMALSVCILRI